MPPIAVHELLLKDNLDRQDKEDAQAEVTLQNDLTRSIRLGDLGRVKYLCEYTRVSVSHRDRFGATPLYYACLCGHVEIVRYLLANGAKADEKTFDGERAYYAALTDEIRKVLKEEGFRKKKARGHDLFLSALERLWTGTGDPTHHQIPDPSLFADLDVVVTAKTKQNHQKDDDEGEEEERRRRRRSVNAAETSTSERDDFRSIETTILVKQVHMFVLMARCPRLASFLEKRSSSTREKRRVVVIPHSYLSVMLCAIEWVYTNRLSVPMHVLTSKTNMDFLRKVRLGDQDCFFDDFLMTHKNDDGRRHRNRLIVIEPKAHESRWRMQAALAPYAMQAWCKTKEGALCDLHKHLDFCDVLLVAEGSQQEAYACHKALLCVRSEYFKHMFTGSFSESNCRVQRVELPGVESKTLGAFLHWVYADELIEDESVDSLLFSFCSWLTNFCAKD